MSTLKPLAEQVMVITGASSGIGLTTAHTAAKAGAKLVLTARSEDTLQDVVKQINQKGGDAIFVATDIADKLGVEAVAKAAIEKFGRIDTWVNDAGLGIIGRLQDVSDEDNRRLFETNFWGIVYGSLAALPHLKESGGALINLGSEVSEAVVPLQGMYATTKHAVKGFTDALRVELQVEKSAVTVILIQPTAVDTPFPQHAANYTDKEPKLPSPMIEVQEVADAILHAAVHGGRDIKVGLMAKINTTSFNNTPKLADKMAVGQQNRQHYEEAPRHPEGILHEPGQSGEMKGSGGQMEE